MSKAQDIPKKKTGRPPAVIDWELVGNLALVQCTQEEIAAVVGVSRQTLLSKPEFLDIYKRGIEKGKSSLRRAQWKLAMSGNATMCIWLGKQLLGQRDQPMTSGETDWTAVGVAFTRAMEGNS